jgi:DMSO reductase anchor subunit
MDPAYSIIFFSTSSGAGYGLLIWLALGRFNLLWSASPVASAVIGVLALALVSAGLLSSTLHLGHPERAWRAFSQWRSSWLSREGVAAVLAYPPALVFVGGPLISGFASGPIDLAAALTIVLSITTVICTGMIYASIKPIPRWNNGWVLPLYLLFSLTTGGMLFVAGLSLSESLRPPVGACIMMALVLTWGVKLLYWRFIDRQIIVSTPATATGLTALGEVRQLEAPHTSDNYLLKEMGYVIARKHAVKLRRLAWILGGGIPILALAIALSVPASITVSIILVGGGIACLAGALIERWLFFAEARHLVTLFYGRQ